MKYTATSKHPVVIGYVCSHCKALVSLIGMAFGTSTSGSASLANDLAKKGLADAIYSLRNAHVKPFRVAKLHDLDEYGFTYSNLDIPCPFCGHTELWQQKNDKGLDFQPTDWSGKTKVYAIKGIPEENAPHFLDSTDAMNHWKKSSMDKVIADCIARWRGNPQEGYRVRGILNEMYAQVNALNQQVQAIDQGIEPIRTNIASLKAEAQKYSMFSGERRALNGQIRELEKSLSAYNRENDGKRQRLTMQIDSLNDKIHAVLVENPGVMCKMETGEQVEGRMYQYYRYN